MVHYVSQLCNSLADFSAECDVYLIAPEGINENLFNSRVILRKIPSIDRHGYRIDLMIKYLLDIGPDIIHTSMVHPFIVPLLPVLKKIAPVAATVHDVQLHSDQKNLICDMSTLITSKLADLDFVHGEKLKLELIKRGVLNSKISIIPHGDYSFFSSIIHKKINEEENTILFFGRILEYKGIDYLIKAEPLISEKIPNIKIIIAGSGDFSKYESMINNKNHFEIINEYIPDEKVSELFQKSSVVVLPYVEASQTGIIPIAYAFKKPVVATDVGSLSEVIVDGVTGFIVPPRDSKLLADSLLNILLNKNLKNSMGSAAYEFMKENMSWKGIAQKTIVEYQKLLGNFEKPRYLIGSLQ
ncbi:glycosyltransferase [Methanosarcina mazei Tuc01]|uniref:Glycosyltransferase n=1 Tax=Methanosarcina mazei Tuc01 TaxID=1236903 RepID=M1Q450_METMZ|nr:glycosyltransferase family 4 protein [Methanosarcina mazei]AGF97070.1 glycosyltransferase [Methanosarcina mazei Tuc01]